MQITTSGHKNRKDHPLTISPSLRKQFSELLLQFFTLAILNFPREKKLTHQSQKMTRPNSILKQLQNFSCMSFRYHNSLFLVFPFIVQYYWIQFYYRCDPVALEDALCKRLMITPEEVIKRSLDPQSALVSRDGLAKTIYSRLFDW